MRTKPYEKIGSATYYVYDWPPELQGNTEFAQLIGRLNLGYRSGTIPSFKLACDTMVTCKEWIHLPDLVSDQPPGYIGIQPRPWKEQPLINREWGEEVNDHTRPAYIWFGPHVKATDFASQQADMRTHAQKALQLFHDPDNLMLPEIHLEPASIDQQAQGCSQNMGTSSALLGFSRYGCLAFIIKLNRLLAAYKSSRLSPDASFKFWDVGTICYTKERQHVIICGLSGDQSRLGCEFLRQMREATCINGDSSIFWKFFSSSEKAQVLHETGEVRNGGYCMWDALGLAFLYPKQTTGTQYLLRLEPEVLINEAHPRRPPVEGSADRPLYLQTCPSSYDVHKLLSLHGFDIEGMFQHDPKNADAMGKISSMIQAKLACK